MKNAIYYFSGTGNSLAAANVIAKRIGDCEVIDIAKGHASTTENAGTSAAERIGFVFPLYFWGLPSIAHSFLRKLEIAGSPYVFSVITAGGDSASVGNRQIEKLLARKGINLAAGFRVTMPDNYYVFYDTDAQRKAAAALDGAKNVIEKISMQVADKTAAGIEGPSHWYENALARPVNALFRQNVHGAGRHFRVSGECTGCGKCVRACSVGNVSMADKRPVWGSACEQCYGCINACPVKAISYKSDKKILSQYLHPSYAQSAK
jgi:ferredoxin